MKRLDISNFIDALSGFGQQKIKLCKTKKLLCHLKKDWKQIRNY